MKSYCSNCNDFFEHINKRCLRCGYTKDINLWQKRDKMNPCNHNTLHFEGKNIQYIVCVCGRKWERFTEYSKSIKITRYKLIEEKK